MIHAGPTFPCFRFYPTFGVLVILSRGLACLHASRNRHEPDTWNMIFTLLLHRLGQCPGTAEDHDGIRKGKRAL